MELFTEHTPPNLGRLFGYQQSSPLVAFFWGKKIGTHVHGYVFDGKAFAPINQLAWDTFFSHSLIVAMNHQRINGQAIKRFEFGDAQQPSKYWLLLDRRVRCLYATPKQSALDHLKTTSSSFAGPQPSPSPAETVAGRASPVSKGALQMITEMTTWLDNRKADLKRNGQWPILS